ncbi:54S ribosomal protein yml6, mitochondrial [Malassezia obtusa]|uniref:Large ribosomal subunit protein uL4m n=1 Tax=Malassezia obtusa TaxID=76774 RepID=A0AAF0E1M2_9BASI|nr:54S ribosomal protein yml6, mitochondrial [Malassezia obtusa]
MLGRAVRSARAWLHARPIHTSAVRAQAVGEDATVAEAPEFFALERTEPVVHARLSYLDKATRPEGLEGPQYVPLSTHVFNTQPHQHAMHLATVYYLDALRSGTASTKTRSEVSFSGKRLRPQKGTGHARLSDAGNPMLRKGGVAHGPRPRDFATDLPRKVRELALRSALSARLREGNLHVVPSLAWQPPPTSTNKLARLLSDKAWSRAVFLTAPRRPVNVVEGRRAGSRPSAADPVYDEVQLRRHARYVRPFAVAARNLPGVELLELHTLPPHIRPRAEHAKKPGELHAYQVLQHPKVVLDLGALEWLEEKLGGAAVQELYAEELRQLAATYPPEAETQDAKKDTPDEKPPSSATGAATDAASFAIADALAP